MKVVAIIRRYNDFDQLLPIIDYSIKTKKIDFEVFTINIDDTYNSHSDYLMNRFSIRQKNIFLTLYKGPFKIIYNLRNVIIGKKKSFSKVKFGGLVFFFLIRIIDSFLHFPIKKYLKTLNKNDVIIMDTGSEANFPNKSILKYGKKYGIKVNCFAHGYFIWTNLDNTRKGMLSKSNSNSIRKFIKGKRINADKYLTAPLQKKYYFNSSSAIGFNKNALNKVYEIGAPRFTREWSKILKREVFKSMRFNYGDASKTNVVFFLSHFQYNVIEDEFFDTFNALSNIENINFVYKPHTRGHLAGIDEKLLNGFNAYEIPSILLSDWADVGILFGSSIGFQLLLDEVPIIIPKYIHTNNTLFEKYRIALEVNSCKELVNLLNNNNFDLNKILLKENICKFIDSTFYGDMPYKEMMNKYTMTLGI
ncbi:MAG: hypothetical protein CMG74_13035 [Candidatus Marinimicrobia bacterium]|nr:hypothetical protein [Candidatus Neomarinimicrobiota bacterium]